MKDGSAARIEPLTLKVLDVSMHGGTHSTCVLVRKRDVPADPDALTGVSKKIVDWMASTVFMDGVTDAQLRTLINAPNQTFYRVLGKLLERGIVQRGSNKSSPYYLTDRGKYLAVQHSLGRHRK
jgi:predicted transcriptional regulator